MSGDGKRINEMRTSSAIRIIEREGISSKASSTLAATAIAADLRHHPRILD
jgi:hypothetical protein